MAHMLDLSRVRCVLYAAWRPLTLVDYVAARSIIRHGYYLQLACNSPIDIDILKVSKQDTKFENFTAHIATTDLAAAPSKFMHAIKSHVERRDEVLLCVQEGEEAFSKEMENQFGELLSSHIHPQVIGLHPHRTADCHTDIVEPTNLVGEPLRVVDLSGVAEALLSKVFAASRHAFAFVNVRPVISGHVLVCPRRCVKRYMDLSRSELHDLHTLVQTVGRMLEAHHKADSLTITIQDGPAAGQTVPHVHVHVLPRWKDDLPLAEKDEVYTQIDKSSKAMACGHTGGIAVDPFPHIAASKKIAPHSVPAVRSLEDMATEARAYREICVDSLAEFLPADT